MARHGIDGESALAAATAQNLIGRLFEAFPVLKNPEIRVVKVLQDDLQPKMFDGCEGKPSRVDTMKIATRGTGKIEGNPGISPGRLDNGPMHASSLENMQRCYEEYLSRSSLLSKQAIRVLDIGGADVNGSYRDIFSDDLFEYMAVDLAEGPGVDLVIEDPYQLPFAAASFDLVISGQVFEHVEFFWKLFEEMVRVTSPEGFIFLIVPSSGPIHRSPVD